MTNNKSQITVVVLIAFFVGTFGSILFGRLIFPYLANYRGLSFLNKLSSNAPIIINRREQVVLNEGANIIDLMKRSGNFTVSIYGPKNNFLGNGIIATSDGLVLTANSIVASQTAVTVTTNEGQNFPAALKLSDPKTNLALLFISASNLPQAQFDNAADLEPGQRVIYIGRSNVKFEHSALVGFITQSLANQLGKSQIVSDAVTNADYLGGPIVNLSGKVVGMTLENGQNIISEELQKTLTKYLTK